MELKVHPVRNFTHTHDLLSHQVAAAAARGGSGGGTGAGEDHGIGHNQN
jgi:hypothetical protein